MVGLVRGLAKHAAHRATLGVRTIPQFAIVDLPAPQRQIEVTLRGPLGAVDVTSRTVAVSLDPLRIGVGLPRRADAPPAVAALSFRETIDERAEVGRLDLRLHECITLPDGELAVFRPIGGTDACVSPLRRSFYYGWKRWKGRHRPGPKPDFADFKNLLIHYICPRPVALVTVMETDGAQGNLFPMDLLAQVGPQSFVAALKNSNRAMEQVRRSRRMVVSKIPFALGIAAYALADMHRAEHIDWEAVPFALARSAHFGYRIPAGALTTTEIEILRTENMGSHTALIGVAVHEQRVNEGRGMHHVSGLYEEHCRARGRALVPVTAGR
jgi:flavin reductase (DIM6/NTAB) family NADH-FMN oxidoreductase RutF